MIDSAGTTRPPDTRSMASTVRGCAPPTSTGAPSMTTSRLPSNLNSNALSPSGCPPSRVTIILPRQTVDSGANNRRHHRADRRREGRDPHPIGEAAEPFGQRRQHAVGLGDHRQRSDHVVVDGVAHGPPLARLGQAAQLGLEVAPAVHVEDGAVGGRRGVEADLRPRRRHRRGHLLLRPPGGDHRHGGHLEVGRVASRRTAPRRAGAAAGPRAGTGPTRAGGRSARRPRPRRPRPCGARRPPPTPVGGRADWAVGRTAGSSGCGCRSRRGSRAARPRSTTARWPGSPRPARASGPRAVTTASSSGARCAGGSGCRGRGRTAHPRAPACRVRGGPASSGCGRRRWRWTSRARSARCARRPPPAAGTRRGGPRT